ncbi:MAG: sulfotransferase [Porticoccaceae bacterium]
MTQFSVPLLSAQNLLAQARASTGIDIDDRNAFEPLSVLITSLNADSRLHDSGAAAMQEKLLRLLCNRLRMQRDFAVHPNIAEQEIRAPIVICGMARTGSTKLQKLLSASGDFNWLPYWQVHGPSLVSGDPGESTAPRIRDAERFCQWFDQESPEAKYGHAFEAHEPDEESYILEHSLRTPCFMGWSELPGYLQWLLGQDMTLQFHYLRDALKYLQWQGLHDPEKRWVLKCPLYFGLEPQLLSVFPDATLVMTHRHPSETIASSCRLLETFHMPFTFAPVDPAAFLAGTAAQMAQHLQVREQQRDIRFLDLHFSEIVKSPATTAAKIYDYCGIALTEQALTNMLDWNRKNPRHKQGVHRYALADYGFSPDVIAREFKEYTALIDTLQMV